MKRLPFRITTVVVITVAVCALIMGPRLVDSVVSAVVRLQNAGYDTLAR